MSDKAWINPHADIFKKIDIEEVLDSNTTELNVEDSTVIDVCFMIDCTDSMSPWISQTAKMIVELQKRIHHYYHGRFRFSFVKYTDYFVDTNKSFKQHPQEVWEDYQFDFTQDIFNKEKAYELFPWTENANEFEEFLTKIADQVAKTSGAGWDWAEDVFGGLEKVLNDLKWEDNHANILIHISDAPCHGKRFQPANCTKLDDSPNGHPTLKIEDLLKTLSKKRIRYWFGYINKSDTDKMIEEFNIILNELDPNLRIKQFDSEVRKKGLDNEWTNELDYEKVKLLREKVFNNITNSVSDFLIDIKKVGEWKEGEPIHFYAVISERRRNAMKALSSPTLKFEVPDSDYFKTTTISVTQKIQQYYYACVTLYPRSNQVSIVDIPQKIKITLSDDFKTHDLLFIGLKQEQFLSHLACKKKPKNVSNILLFGFTGSTKSSFIAAACTALDQTRFRKDKAVVGGSTGHITTKLQAWNLKHKNFIYPYRLWDTVGLDQEVKNYSGETFLKILQGYIHDKIPLDDLRTVKETKYPISAVIFFVEARAFAQEGVYSEGLLYLKKFLDITVKEAIQPLVVLSKADKVGFVPTFNAENYRFKQFQKRAATFFGVQDYNIFPLMTYDQSNLVSLKKDFNLDRLASHILVSAFKIADCNSKYEKLFDY